MTNQRSNPVVRARLKRKAEWLVEQKSHPCVDCGNTFDPVCMDFHHLDPSTKKYRIASLVNNDQSLKTIQEEIDKCVLVCANCHRLRHKYDLYSSTK